jgi:hypothetical protein
MSDSKPQQKPNTTPKTPNPTPLHKPYPKEPNIIPSPDTIGTITESLKNEVETRGKKQ